MADDLLYPFSDEEEDALLDRAFDRWEQLGGGSARGPLFQFTCNPSVDDAAGARWWNAHNSMRNYGNCGILSLGIILAWP